MTRHFKIFYFILLVVFCHTFFIQANDAPIKSVGKTIQPRNDVPVRMVSEEVTIRLSSHRADVHCLFDLLNEGPPDTIDVGFPRGWENDLLGFGAKAGRTVLKVEDVTSEPSYNEWNGQELPWWKTFRVPFYSTGQTVKVENNYWTPLMPYGHTGLDDLFFTYIMKTGAFWKGKIKEATFTVYHVDIPFDQFTKISPEGFTREPHRIIWHFKDFVPTENIEISIMQDILYDRLVNARKILKDDPDNAHAHFLLGTVYFNQDLQSGRTKNKNPYEKAEQKFHKTLSLDPEHLDARWYLAMIYSHRNSFKKEKDFSKTKTQLEKIIGPNPDYRCEDKAFTSSKIISLTGHGASSAAEWLKSF